MFMPIPLTTGVVSEQGSERYILKKDDFLGYVLHEWHDNNWRELYAFTEEPQLAKDFIAPSFYCEKHPDSIFRTMDMVHIFTDTGRKSVAGRMFKFYTPRGVEVIRPVSDDDYHRLLDIHFGIRLER